MLLSTQPAGRTLTTRPVPAKGTREGAVDVSQRRSQNGRGGCEEWHWWGSRPGRPPCPRSVSVTPPTGTGNPRVRKRGVPCPSQKPPSVLGVDTTSWAQARSMGTVTQSRWGPAAPYGPPRSEPVSPPELPSGRHFSARPHRCLEGLPVTWCPGSSKPPLKCVGAPSGAAGLREGGVSGEGQASGRRERRADGGRGF